MPLEIERVWLLSAAPPIPSGAERWEISQGYLVEGRVRQVRNDDGSVRFFHTIKRGTGLVRTEVEREISEVEWSRAWPRTMGARLTKTRWRIADGSLIWEVDIFSSFELCLAEVELPTPDASPAVPSWLASSIIREVTDDARYGNATLARLGPPR